MCSLRDRQQRNVKRLQIEILVITYLFIENMKEEESRIFAFGTRGKEWKLQWLHSNKWPS